jgi:hypothetical protein
MGKSIAVLVCCLSVAGSVVSASSSSAGAAASKTGVITGKVMECGPGPIVVTPPAPQPLPKPASVILMHDGNRYALESIKFPKLLPWSGSFLFNVPAGRYKVLSTYFERVRWVNVKPGSRTVVTFAPIACPL